MINFLISLLPRYYLVYPQSIKISNWIKAKNLVYFLALIFKKYLDEIIIFDDNSLVDTKLFFIWI
jgi:hypothetical protein